MKLMRGRWHLFGSIPVMATFHPSYLLRNQALSVKRKVWEDMLQVLEPTRPSDQREAEELLPGQMTASTENHPQKIDSNRSRVLFPGT